MNWYYVDQGKQAGPVDEPQLVQLSAEGRIQDETLVWREGMANWQPYRDVKSSFAVVPPPPPISSLAPPMATPSDAVCSECGQMFSKENMIRHGNAWVCANCKPVFVQKLAEGARLNTGQLRYAGFWIRFAAKFLDGLILGVVLVLPLLIIMFIFVGAAAGRGSQLHLGADGSMHAAGDASAGIISGLFRLFLQLIYVGANALYSGFFIGKYGATPGKMACKLIVVDPAGGKISYGRSFGRGFAEILSGAICDIGYIIAAFDGEKRALHDHICGTRVIYKE